MNTTTILDLIAAREAAAATTRDELRGQMTKLAADRSCSQTSRGKRCGACTRIPRVASASMVTGAIGPGFLSKHSGARPADSARHGSPRAPASALKRCSAKRLR